MQIFPSTIKLKAAHNELLKEHRELLERRKEDESPNVIPSAFLDKIQEFIENGRVIGEFIDSEDDRWSAQGLLDYWTTVLFRAGRTSPDATLADFNPEQSPELSDAVCPYLGLDAFQEINSIQFFGRRRLVEEMVEKLGKSQLLAIVGPSGSGKSSAVFAGLLPAIRSGALDNSQNWIYYPAIVPGSDPIANLALLLKPAVEKSAAWINNNKQNFIKNSKYLLEIVESRHRSPSVIVVDQFEEIFTLCTDDTLANSFVANLLALTQSSSYRHVVIITVRSDFEPKIARLESFFAAFQLGRVTVTPLSANELRDSIEKPAEYVGLKFEAGIVDQLVKEILGEPAGLPLLQFSLLSLWKKRKRNRITWEIYKEIGGPREALTLSADEFYNALIPQDQITAKRIFLRLARTSEGFEVFRNRVKREVLYKSGEAHDQVDRVLEKLIAARLLHLTNGETSADDQIEVAHEALVRNWKRLVEWIEQDRAKLQQRLRLTAAAEQWREHGKDPGGLLGGSLLQEALEYQDLSDLENEFIAVSKEFTDLAEKEKEAAKAREIEQAANLANLQKLSNQRLRRLIALLLLLFVASIIIAIKAYDDRNTAIKASKIAEEERGKAEKSKLLADEERANALELKKIADQQSRAAIDAELLEKAQRKIAEKQREIAVKEQLKASLAAREATAARDSLEIQKERALKALREAEVAKRESDKQKEIALNALREKEAAEHLAEQQKTIANNAVQEANQAKSNNVSLKNGVPAVEEFSSELRKRVRPLRPGASVGSRGATGSICCFVQDASGAKYILNLGFIFSGNIKSPIFQPGIGDGAENKSNIVAYIDKRVSNGLNRQQSQITADENNDFVLARIVDGVQIESILPKIGKIRGIAQSISLGQKVYLVGRGSGIASGRILTIEDVNGDIVTSGISQSGDGGAPVVTEDGMLVGILWGGSSDKSYIIPIKQILTKLNVTLVL